MKTESLDSTCVESSSSHRVSIEPNRNKVNLLPITLNELLEADFSDLSPSRRERVSNAYGKILMSVKSCQTLDNISELHNGLYLVVGHLSELGKVLAPILTQVNPYE